MILPSRLLSLVALAATLLCSSYLIGGASEADAKTPAVDLGNQAWTQPLFGGGIKTNDVYTDGNIFFTVPVWSTIGTDNTLGGDYLFLEPYSSVGDQGEVAASLGLSWRHLFSNESVDALHKQGVASFMEEGWFIGGNVFLDMLDTQHNNNFWQMGVGAEAGARYFEVRGNYYIPMTGEKLYDRLVNTQTFVSQSASTVYNTAITGFHAEPFATGNSIVQGASSETIAHTSIATTTTTVRSVTELFEKGMQGWDVEASVLIPWLDQWMDLRVIGGYLSFNNQPFGPQDGPTGPVRGWKAGAELRPVPAVVLGSMWYEDRRFAGSNWIVSAELQVPMDKTWKDAFKMRRRHLVEHLAEPVHRQNDAIKVGNREDQQTSVSTSTSVQHVTKVVAQTPGRIVLKDDVVFVNNGGAVGNGIQAGSPAGDGTAESPVTTIQAGADLAQANSNSALHTWNVYTQGTSVPYVERIRATTGSVNFISSGQFILGRNGKNFGAGPAPSVLGNIVARRIGFLGVNGYQITGVVPGQAGISATDVVRVVIADNTLTNSGGPGVHIAYNGPRNASDLITGNTISGSQGNGIEVFLPATGTLVIADNKVSHSTGAGILLGNVIPVSASNLAVTGNTVSQNGGDGISANLSGSSISVTAALSGNSISGSGGNGMSFVVSGVVQSDMILSSEGPVPNPVGATTGASVVLTVANNTITNSAGQGLNVDVTSTTGSSVDFDESILQSTVFNAVLSGNNISNSGGSGLTLHYSGLNPVASSTVSGNTVVGSGAVGMNIDTNGFIAIISQVITGNAIIDSGNDGLKVNVGGLPSTVNSLISSNVIFNSGGDGMRMTTSGETLFGLAATINNNTIARSGGDGLSVSLNPLIKTEAVAMTSNTITTSGGNGIKLNSGGTSGFGAMSAFTSLDLNHVSGYLGDGMLLISVGATATVNGTLNSALTNTVGSASGPGFFRVHTMGPVSGSFYLNGVLITLPTNVP